MGDGRYFLGIDESGRGPLAGPICVACVRSATRAVTGFYKDEVVRDSKRLSPQKRRVIFVKLQSAAQAGSIAFCVSCVWPRVIDRVGIDRAARCAITRVLRRLAPDGKGYVLLDGGLRAPARYERQQTLVKGDTYEPLIALASIVAKVHRDSIMERLGRRYPAYRFEQHKGYATHLHRMLIRRHRPSPVHRLSFLHPRRRRIRTHNGKI